MTLKLVLSEVKNGISHLVHQVINSKWKYIGKYYVEPYYGEFVWVHATMGDLVNVARLMSVLMAFGSIWSTDP